MNFLITNSVPLNGGDEALLRALVTALTNRWPDSKVTVLCKDLELARKQLPDLNLEADLEFAKTEESRRDTFACYHAADVVLSAPGGFLHDYYSIEERLQGFEVALGLSKPLVLIGQSIGPFWKSRSMKRVRKVLNRASCICVRDFVSSRHLAKCGVNPAKVRVTGDAAFLWHRIAPELFKPKKESNTRLVGLSFRVWPLGDQAMQEKTITKAEQLCRHLLADRDRRILFLSTCQGIPGYVDDSQVASLIRDRLPEELQARCELDRARYGPVELIQALGRCDAFIGMRLHACILSMLAGVPAMGLGYEDKTQEIFGQMGLESYQIPFTSEVESWIEKAEYFFANVSGIRERLAKALDERCMAAEENIKVIEEQLPKMATPEVSALTTEQRWTQSVERYGRPHLRLRQVAALVKELEPKRMLDVGCATGHLRMLCSGVEYTGCDFIAPAPPVGFPFHQCNFNRESFPSGLEDFDVVVCSGVLEYIDNTSAFLASLRSALTAEGHLVITYFNMNHISRIWRLVSGRSFPVHPDWRGFYSPREVQRVIEKSGFQILKSIATSHALRPAVSVEQTVSTPLTLGKTHWGSNLLAHQFIFVAAKTPAPDRSRSNYHPADQVLTK
jgi:polysaccharide pyruvyl transferase WcaK-like protein/2-polyprenyl-3-methyl-5-hydroxy-6-metoxy-1,4-benzoquinol methylase